MPIPPRPIPTAPAHSRRPAARPGVVPRKEHKEHRGSLQTLVADSRAEMALLPSFGSSAPGGRSMLPGHHHHAHSPRSPSYSPPFLGSPTHSGAASPLLRAATPPVVNPGQREVPLASLMDGRGRPKRTGAAAQLGFDFVPRPEVVALGDEPMAAPVATEPAVARPRASLWPWSGVAVAGTTPPATGGAVGVEEAVAVAGVATPTPPTPPPPPGPATPALEPTRSDDDDDDWEHVCAEDQDDAHDDDALSIVGELELELELKEDANPQLKGPGTKGKTAPRPSYAAAAMVNP